MWISSNSFTWKKQRVWQKNHKIVNSWKFSWWLENLLGTVNQSVFCFFSAIFHFVTNSEKSSIFLYLISLHNYKHWKENVEAHRSQIHQQIVSEHKHLLNWIYYDLIYTINKMIILNNFTFWLVSGHQKWFSLTNSVIFGNQVWFRLLLEIYELTPRTA